MHITFALKTILIILFSFFYLSINSSSGRYLEGVTKLYSIRGRGIKNIEHFEKGHEVSSEVTEVSA